MLMPANNPLPLPIEAERVTEAPSNVPTGPSFQVIEETTWEALEASGRQLPFERPVLVKGDTAIIGRPKDRVAAFIAG